MKVRTTTSDDPLKQSGIILLAIGLLDIGVMAYCMVAQINYASIFNVFAVAAGVLLIRGSAKTARIIRWLSIFMAVAIVGILIVAPAFVPPGLLFVSVKLNPAAWIGYYLLGLTLAVLLIWIYLELSTQKALGLQKEAGCRTNRPHSAFVAGGAITALVIGILLTLRHSEAARIAQDLAREQLGSHYQYYVISLTATDETNIANVAAYTPDKIRNVEVEWERQ